jgi:hypothetical protein
VDSALVVAAEIQDAQAAIEDFGTDAVVDSLGDADATHTSGTAALRAPKSLKQIFSKGENFSATERGGRDQGRVPLSLDFFREVFVSK